MDLARFVARQIGSRIRQARRTHKMTLEALGKKVALSPAFLSRVEQGKATPSIANLIVISQSLGLQLRDIFEDRDIEDATPTHTLSRLRERQAKIPLKSGDYSFYRLGRDLPDQRMNAFELEFPVGPGKDVEPLIHEGEEVLYVLEGRIEFQIGANSFVMEAGDCVHFICETPHHGRNVGSVPARMLMVVSPSGSLAQRFDGKEAEK